MSTPAATSPATHRRARQAPDDSWRLTPPGGEDPVGGGGKQLHPFFRFFPVVGMGAGFNQEEAGGHILVVLAVAVEDPLDQTGVFPVHRLFDLACKRLVGLAVGVLPPYHQLDSGGFFCPPPMFHIPPQGPHPGAHQSRQWGVS